MIKKISLTVFILLTLVSLTGCGKNQTTTPKTTAGTTTSTAIIQTSTTTVIPTEAVPAEYQTLYTTLDSELASFETVLKQKWNGQQAQPVIATELAFANGNIGPALLTASMLDENKLMLDRLQAMGVKGVVLGIKFPLLKPDFPHAAEYLQFYQNIIAECHKRNMKVLVECGAIFSGTAYSSVQVDWSTYTAATFLQGVQDQLLVIANQIKPDYLTLANEPTTEEALTGFTITPQVWSDFIAGTLKKIDRSSGILIGAGTGTWESQTYINTLFNMPELDYIDLHIYALNTDGALLTKALTWATQARAAGKRVTVSEGWLWKAAPAELGTQVAVSETIMNRDVYSFWAPLDERFFQDMISLADATNMDFMSFFWTRNLFGYIDYNNTTRNLSTAEYNREINQGSLAAVQNGSLSPLGLFYQAELKRRDGK